MTQAIFLGMKGSPMNFSVHTFTPTFTRAQNLATELGGKAYKEVSDLPKSKYYFLGPKPQMFKDLAGNLRPHISNDAIVISIMAGITVSRMQQTLGVKKIIRVMPSTPAMVGKGISIFYASADVQEDELSEVKNLFKNVSKVIQAKSEDEFDRLMTVSGCGPGYIFELGRILSEYLAHHGISKGTADLVASELFLGVATYMQQSHESFETLRNNVTSKKGATEQVLLTLKERGLEEIFHEGLNKAYKRAKELSE